MRTSFDWTPAGTTRSMLIVLVDCEKYVLIARKAMVPGAVTVKAAGMDFVVEVPVPTMLKLYVPATVEELTLTDMVELPPAVTDAGLNEAVAPDGRPLV